MKYLFFLLLPLAYLAGNIYLFFRGKAAFAAQSTGVKVLLLIISVLFAIQANAQTQEESPAVTIDSLSTKLEELQHNYDFLYLKSI